MTIKSANTLLQGLEEEKTRIDGVNFGNAKKMFSLLDKADYVSVYSFYSCYLVLFLVYLIYNLIFPCTEAFPAIIEIRHGREFWNQKYTIWYRDPIELIQNLFGNPMFKDEMVYATERHVNAQGMYLYLEIH